MCILTIEMVHAFRRQGDVTNSAQLNKLGDAMATGTSFTVCEFRRFGARAIIAPGSSHALDAELAVQTRLVLDLSRVQDDSHVLQEARAWGVYSRFELDAILDALEPLRASSAGDCGHCLVYVQTWVR